MNRYAATTNVAPSRSRDEIEKFLLRYGAEGFMYGHDHGFASIAFRTENRMVRIVIPLPDRDRREFTHTPTGKRRTATQAEEQWLQAVRQRWRALALVVKAKLEAVASGIVTFDQEFAPHIVLPDGRTVAEWLVPQIEAAYETGEMPDALPVGRLPAVSGVRALPPGRGY